MDNALKTILGAAEKNHLVEIEYRKPGEARPMARIVEPYGLQSVRGKRLVRCWQVDPDPLGDAWRSFRAGRIVGAREINKEFEPREPITLTHGKITTLTHEPETTEESPSRRYYTYLEAAMLDGRITKEEMHEARRIAEPLDRNHLRAAHAHVYRDVLDELLIDGRLDDAEEDYLRRVSVFLHRLGWVPALVEEQPAEKR